MARHVNIMRKSSHAFQQLELSTAHQCARLIGVTAHQKSAQKWMARHVNIMRKSSHTFQQLELATAHQCARLIGVTAHQKSAQKWMARHVNIMRKSSTHFSSLNCPQHISVPGSLVSLHIKRVLKNGWRGTLTS